MAIPLIVPVLAGAGALAAFVFGSSKTANAATSAPNPAASNAAKEALKKRDFQSAAANALASRTESTVREVAKGMVAAGKSEEAKSLATAFKQMMAAPKPKAKAAPKPKAKPKGATKAVSSSVVKAPAPSKTVSASVVTAPRVSAPLKAKDPKYERALALAKHLASATRYKENRELVKAFQKENGLASSEGMYGPASAQLLWNVYSIVPPNPFYWPKAPKTQAALAQYQKFLDEIVKNDPSTAKVVANLKGTVGR